MAYYFKRGKNATEMQEKNCAVYEEGAVTERVRSGLRSCMSESSRWTMDAPWLGGPVEVDSDQIKTSVENSQHYTMWEIAGHTQNIQISKLLVKMKNVPFILWKTLNGLFGQPNPCMFALKICGAH